MPTEKKMKGVLAQLNTYTEDGVRINSKLIFKPHCRWDIKHAGDGYADTSYEIEGAVEEFGLDAVYRAAEKGEIVKVEKDIPEGFLKVSCPREVGFVKRSGRVHYPWPGYKEYLIDKEFIEEEHRRYSRR